MNNSTTKNSNKGDGNTNNQNASDDIGNAELLAQLLKRFDDLSRDIGVEVKKQLTELKSFIKEIVKEEIAENDKQHSIEVEAMKKRLEYLEFREESRSRNEKRNNLVLHNIELSTKDHKLEVKQFLNEKLGITVEISEVVLLKTANRKQLVVIKVPNDDDRRLILGKRNRLEDSDCYITHDRTKKEREVQKSIMQIAEEEKSRGNNVIVGYRKLTINGKTKYWREGKDFFAQGLLSSPSASQGKNRKSPSPFFRSQSPKFAIHNQNHHE